MSNVYILVDPDGNIVACDGGYSWDNVQNKAEWVCIDSGIGDKYNLCQSNYFMPPLFDEMSGDYNWQYIDGKVVRV